MSVTARMYFINEDGEVYDFDVVQQAVEFPNDDHTPYLTRADAENARDAAATLTYDQRFGDIVGTVLDDLGDATLVVIHDHEQVTGPRIDLVVEDRTLEDGEGDNARANLDPTRARELAALLVAAADRVEGVGRL